MRTTMQFCAWAWSSRGRSERRVDVSQLRKMIWEILHEYGPMRDYDIGALMSLHTSSARANLERLEFMDAVTYNYDTGKFTAVGTIDSHRDFEVIEYQFLYSREHQHRIYPKPTKLLKPWSVPRHGSTGNFQELLTMPSDVMDIISPEPSCSVISSETQRSVTEHVPYHRSAYRHVAKRQSRTTYKEPMSDTEFREMQRKHFLEHKACYKKKARYIAKTGKIIDPACDGRE